MSETGVCVAPGCGDVTASPYHALCDADQRCIEEAMRRARPSLLEMMKQERAEAEIWLLSEWAPTRRWVVADGDHHEIPVEDVVASMVDETMSSWGDPTLGFVDDGLSARRAQWYQKLSPEQDVPEQTAWKVAAHSEPAEAWRTHLGPILQEALTRALASFPLTHAGREIKRALTATGGYDHDDAGEAFDEIWEGTGPTQLSEAAEDYLELRYMRLGWMCDPDPDGPGAGLWRRYRVLSDAMMEILDAVAAFETARQREEAR